MSTVPRLLFAALAVLLLLLGACFRQEPEATPVAPTETSAPEVIPTAASPEKATPEPPAPTARPAEGDWLRVREAGKLVVGTSADYPPFAYYNENFALDGFDVALVQRIADQLGVDVEMKDFAFDGLLGAVELGQIDMAIAAISITPEREQLVDFSNPYYVGEEAVLVVTDSPVNALSSATELIDKRIGVQRGSVYESWAEATLIQEELMPASNLLSFGNTDQAVNSLKEGRIDLVLLDYLPAQEYVLAGGVRQVARGLSRQQFGMVVPRGSTLQPELNRALAQLQDDNVVADLVSQYLDLESDEVILPTPAPEPTAVPGPTATPEPQATATPTPEPRCIDGMQWVQDLNYDDQNMTAPPILAPGQSFVKGWRVRNSGTCPWNNSYALNFAYGNRPGAQMSGNPVTVQGVLPSGGTYDLQLPLVAPQEPGVYQGFWQMRNGDGVSFGERIWVGISVPGQPTPVPVPTQTPVPGIYFVADRTNIKAGEPVNFTWRVSNVQAVYFYPDGQPWEQNGVAGEASRTEYPQQTTTYNLRVVKRDGSVETRQITVYVEQVANAPVINQFTVSPRQISAGGCVNINWDVWGDVSNVRLSFNDIIIWDGAPVRSSFDHCPPSTGTLNYHIEASGPGGTSKQQQTVTAG